MTEKTMQELNSAIDEFEQTIGVLRSISVISNQTAKTAENIEALCEQLRETTSDVTKSTGVVESAVKEFDLEFRKAAEQLLTVREVIEKSNRDAGNEVRDRLTDSERRLTAEIAELKAQGGILRNSVDSMGSVLSERIDSEEKRIIDTVETDISSTHTELNAVEKRIGNTLDQALYKLTKLQILLTGIEEIKKQNEQNRKMIIVGVVCAGIAMISSIISLFI